MIQACLGCYPRLWVATNIMLQVLRDGRISKDGALCYMVAQESACRIGVMDNFHKEEPLNTDHSDTVKLPIQADDVYVRVLDRLKILTERAPGFVRDRFSLVKSM